MKSRVEVPLFRRLAYLADATITKSEEMAQVLPAGLRRRNHVIPNGVDLREFQPATGWSRDEPSDGNPRSTWRYFSETLATLERISAWRATPSHCLASAGSRFAFTSAGARGPKIYPA